MLISCFLSAAPTLYGTTKYRHRTAFPTLDFEVSETVSNSSFFALTGMLGAHFKFPKVTIFFDLTNFLRSYLSTFCCCGFCSGRFFTNRKRKKRLSNSEVEQPFASEFEDSGPCFGL